MYYRSMLMGIVNSVSFVLYCKVGSSVTESLTIGYYQCTIEFKVSNGYHIWSVRLIIVITMWP